MENSHCLTLQKSTAVSDRCDPPAREKDELNRVRKPNGTRAELSALR